MESVGNIILYFIVAIAIIVFSVLTVTTRKILRSATYLLFVLFATAIIYFQMDYQFLGAVQIAVYAGGILVLFVFAIMLTQRPGKDADVLASQRRWIGLIAALAGVAVCGYGLFSYADFGGRLLSSGVDINMEKIGQFLLSTDKYGYLLPFEAISVLLLACIIGGVVVARRR
jgi:NADH-quinone oxidoreductase subunit J